MDEADRIRGKRSKIRVTFPSGKTICFKNVTNTLIEALKEIGSDRFDDVKLEIGKLPLLSKEIYPKYKDYMKEICNGWYINTMSNSDQKFLQLRAINDSLNLGLIVEFGEDFETQDTVKKFGSKSKEKLMVRFPDGEYIAANNSSQTFLDALWKIGFENLTRLKLEFCGRPLFSRFSTKFHTIQVDNNLWMDSVGGTKDRARMLKIISISLKLNLEITTI